MAMTGTMRGTMRAAACGLLWAVSGFAATIVDQQYGEQGSSRYPYLCSDADIWPDPDCCSDDFDCTATSTSPTDRANILLVIADDQDYCLFGFMAGVCSQRDADGKYVSCLSEDACEAGPGGRCVGSRDLGTCDGDGSTPCYVDGDCPSDDCSLGVPPSGTDAPPLRLNDLSCRNRQPKRPKKDKKWCDSTNDNPEEKLDRKQLRFSREGAPCQEGLSGPTPPAAHPPAFTPHLDELAGHGAVFPRAYVAGIICKNSRRAMLHGRYLRHLQWLWETGSKRGRSECGRVSVDDDRRGCGRELESSGCGNLCEPAHTLAWWLATERAEEPWDPDSEDLLDPQDLSLPEPADEAGYRRFAFAKLDVMKAGRGGFEPKARSSQPGSKLGRGPGKIRCGTDSDCGTTLTSTVKELTDGFKVHTSTTIPVPAYPTEQVFDVRGHSHYELTQAIDSTMEMADGESPVQTNPVFVWWGPHMPHAGPKAETPFYDLYDASVMHRRALGHYARVSWFDASLGGVLYHLQRACTCDGSTAQSLWENTVVIVLSDQGYLLPEAKGNTHENTQRTPLIINAPDLRDDPAIVFDHEMASAVDLMPTMMAYAGDVRYFPAGTGGNDNADEYPLGRNLKDWIDNPTNPGSWDRQRNLTFGEDLNSSGTNNKKPGGASPRHIVTRPGLFGTCYYPYNFTEADENDDPSVACGANDVCFKHPCLTNDDCKDFGPNEVDLGTWIGFTPAFCITKNHPGVSKWKRCANRPWVRCNADSDCAASWCGGSGCTPGSDPRGFYNDFAGQDCDSSSDCVPPGVCQPVTLKVEWRQGDDPVAVWDLDWDPDQQTNLLSYPGSEYFLKRDEALSETTLKAKFNDCMGHFLEQETTSLYDWMGENASDQCPEGLKGW